MEKYAFKLQLKPGFADEYKKRHDEVWPEMVDLLKESGISDYSIHLDEETNILFAVLWRTDDHNMEDTPSNPVMLKWWHYMSDIMERDGAESPTVVPLKMMFHLP